MCEFAAIPQIQFMGKEFKLSLFIPAEQLSMAAVDTSGPNAGGTPPIARTAQRYIPVRQNSPPNEIETPSPKVTEDSQQQVIEYRKICLLKCKEFISNHLFVMIMFWA